MVADMVADKVADMVADMVADVVADMVAKKIYIDININMEIQLGERVGHGGWLIRPVAYPTCVYSKLCEFIFGEITICWPMRSMRVKAGVSAAMNAFLTRPSQTAAFFGRKTRYMFFPKSCVKNT